MTLLPTTATWARRCIGRYAKADLFISEQTNLSPDVEQWLAFAKADLRAARLLLSDAEVPARIACFHAQQAAEKAIKAVLISEQTSFRKTHDVLVLVGLLPVELVKALDWTDPVVLQQWAVDGRYPGDLPDATPSEAAEVLETASAIVALMENHLLEPTTEKHEVPPAA
jgi:HEPN domain-containing protein